MGQVDLAAVERMMRALPHRHRGPGGVAGVVWQGRVVAATAWGHADLDSGALMTRGSLLPICSISKQFTCAAMLASVGAPEALDRGVPDLLPLLDRRPTVRQMCNNQSGLRDYWALTVLAGARAEQEFRREDALPLIAATRSTHFDPGSRYSYSNGNFRIVAELLERAVGEDLATLCARHLWGPAGMETARLRPDTRETGGVTGYEGTPSTGFLPAANGIWWMGDAGMVASLDDMLAWECWLDATRDDRQAPGQRIAAPQVFSDGAAASYGFGLSHSLLGGLAFTGHGGALRGFRAHRMASKAARLGVVVMFNHHGDAQGAAQALARAALGLPEPVPVAVEAAGRWLCPETGLLARIEGGALHFATSPEALRPGPEGTLVSAHSVLRREGVRLRLIRKSENLDTLMEPVAPVDTADAAPIAGRYACAGLGAAMEVEANGPGASVRFIGPLGGGRPEPMHPVGPDLWVVATRRSMDAPAPGDLTLRIRRDAGGHVAGADLGCWLARGTHWTRD